MKMPPLSPETLAEIKRPAKPGAGTPAPIVNKRSDGQIAIQARGVTFVLSREHAAALLQSLIINLA
jgi:hypothetical protein